MNLDPFSMGVLGSLVDESHSIVNPEKYIENAFEKSENAAEFELSKQR